ncbi:MAG TPA: prolipoprotein diacylglyceryl transferase [Clostridiaceae bacterium]|nr:prolipoprotein diacylglyceryl transferase [Clostridiaceae bacterium]
MEFIGFPGLWGLKFNIGRVAFTVFNIPIYWYGIIIAFGFLLAVMLGMKDSRKFGLDPDTIIDLVLFAAPVAIITARLYYVIFSWEMFKDNPIDIINTRKGGLAIYGAVIGAVIVAYIFAKKRKLSVLNLFDFASPYLALAQGIGRWGNFVNQEAYGTPTTLPWGMTGSDIGNTPVHPTFLYESIWDIALFIFLLWFRKRKKLNGEVFFLYMILYGAGRFWIESLRTDSLMLGSLRISQVLAFLFVVVFTIVFVTRRRKAALASTDNIEIGVSEYGAVLERLKEEEENQAGNSVADFTADSTADSAADATGDVLADEQTLNGEISEGEGETSSEKPANEGTQNESVQNESVQNEGVQKDEA